MYTIDVHLHEFGQLYHTMSAIMNIAGSAQFRSDTTSALFYAIFICFHLLLVVRYLVVSNVIFVCARLCTPKSKHSFSTLAHRFIGITNNHC
jgi:hypothetical protein